MKRTAAVVVLGLAWTSAGAAPQKRVSDPRAAEIAQGDAWAMAGRCVDAVPHYEKALVGAADPKIAARLAECLIVTGDATRADAVVKAALAQGRDAELLMAAGDVAMKRGDAVAAIPVYTEAEKGSTRRAARLGRLVALAQLGKGDDEYQRTALELAEKIARDDSEPLENRERADDLLETLRYGAAGKTMQEARGKLAAGDAKGALALIEPVLAMKPPIELAFYAAGLCQQQLDRRKDAAASFRKAPHVKEAQALLGIIAFENDELDDAGKAFDATLALDGRYQQALYYAGLVAKERGDTEKTRTLLARAVSAGPGTPLGKLASGKLELISGQLHSLAEGQVVDAAQEVAIGQALATQITSRFGESPDHALQDRLQGILHRLAKVADRPERELRYHVQIVESPIVNAITLPGGTILVFRGIADLVKKEMGDTDDAWAAILGHECAHAALRHSVDMLSVASSLSSGNAFAAGTVDLAQLLNTISRAHEFEADQFGALYAYRAGFNPGTSLKLYETMMKSQGEIPRGLDHPTFGERVYGVRDYLMELRGKVHGFDLGVKSLKDDELDAAITRFEVFLGVYPDSLSARSNLGVALQRKATRGLAGAAELRRVTDIDPVSGAGKIELHGVGGDAPAKLDKHMLEAAVAEYKSALTVDPSYAPALTNLGAALFDLGDRKGARVALDRAIARAPRAPEAWINHATVAESEGKLPEAQADLRRAVGIDDKAQVAWFDLALVSEKLHRADEAKAAWDKYLALDSRGAWADVARAHRKAIP